MRAVMRALRQCGEVAPAVQVVAQFPDRAAPGAHRRGQLFVGHVEHVGNRAPHQLVPVLRAEQFQARRIGGDDGPVGGHGQGAVVEQVDEFRAMVEPQQRFRLVAAQEQALLDQTRGGVDQRDRVHLRFARPRRVDARCIQDRDDAAVLIVYRRRGTGQSGVGRAKMIGLVNGDGPRLRCAGADAVGPLALFAPLGADDQPGGEEHTLQTRVDLFAENDARRVGQQQGIP